MVNDMLVIYKCICSCRGDEQFNNMLKLLAAANDEYQHLLTEDELLADSQWFEEQDERIFSFKHKIIKWLKEAELNKEEERSRKSVGSRSSKSRSSKSSRSSNHSSRSSIKDKAIEEKIKIAELIAESNFTDQKLKMEYEAKRLEMEEKVAKAQARAKILGLLDMPPLEGEEDAKGRNIVHNKQMTDTNIALDRQHENWKEFIPGKKYHYSNSLFRNGEPSYTPSDHNSQSGEVSKMLCQLLKQQGAPEVEIDVFSGDPLEYHYFMEIFKEVVEKRIEDPRGRLTRLIKYTTGEAKDLIKHCIQQPMSEGYKNALELLRIRYGDPLKVLATYRKEIRRWPTIKAGDASSFRLFHNFLLKCQSVTPNQTWNALDSLDTLCLVMAKFPQHIRARWNGQEQGLKFCRLNCIC